MELKVGDLVHYGMKRFGLITNISRGSVYITCSDGSVVTESIYLAGILKARAQQIKRE